MNKENKEILVDLGDWAIVRFSFEEGDSVVYGEHRIGCKVRDNEIEANLGVNSYASWEYEYSDPPFCWRCAAPVPEAVIGLVKLSNFDNIQNSG